MLVLLFIIAIISGLIFGKSKIVQVYQFSVSLITFSFATNIPDYIGYLLCYESASVQNTSQYYLDAFEPGYRMLNYLFSNLGLNFDQFRMIIFILCYILIMSTIKKYIAKQNIVFSLYLIFPFCMDCIQIRNFIGSAIIIFSLRYLFTKNKEVKKFLIGCFIATLFQSTMIVYSSFSIIALSNQRFRLLYNMLFFTISAICLIQVFIGIPMLNNISYFSNRTSIYTYGVFFIILFTVYRLSKYIDKYTLKMHLASKLGNDNLIKFINMMCIFAPFLIFHFDFFRWIRNILIFLSIAIIEYLNYKKNFTWYKMVTTLAVISIFSLLLYRHAYFSLDISYLERLLQNNILFID